MDHADLKNRFTFHPASAEKAKIYEAIRAQAYEYALWLDENVPDSREKSLAITHLEDTVFWANAAVARH